MKPTLQRGSILILALWSLGLLTVFTISVGAVVQQRISLVSRIERRIQVYDAAEAGIRKAIVLLKSERAAVPLSAQKTALFDSPQFFKAVKVGSAVFEVSYYDGFGLRYGLIDEERKINVNTSDRVTLENLFKEVTPLSEEARQDLASSIIDWREYGESEAGEFFSDEYYDNLKFPYKEKKGDFESTEELRLVKGMTPAVYRAVSPFVTVYGTGKVNINTAPRPVLKALGMSDALTEAVLFIRRGKDGWEGTLDDVLFSAESEIPMLEVIPPLVKLEDGDYFRNLYWQQKIGLESSHYMIQSRGYFDNRKEKKDLTCVFDMDSAKIKYWHEY